MRSGPPVEAEVERRRPAGLPPAFGIEAAFRPRVGVARLPFVADRNELAAPPRPRVAVMPGEPESLGVVGIEATASGVPVVCCSTAPRRPRRRPAGEDLRAG